MWEGGCRGPAWAQSGGAAEEAGPKGPGSFRETTWVFWGSAPVGGCAESAAPSSRSLEKRALPSGAMACVFVCVRVCMCMCV